jgi:hypothetical protein
MMNQERPRALCRRIQTLVIALMLVSGLGVAAEQAVILEITGADLEPSSSSSSTWGWWNPGKYDDWVVGSGSSFELVEGRLLMVGTTYAVLLSGERNPTIDATGSREDPDTGEAVVDDVTLKTAAYDLGLGQVFRPDKGVEVMPWVGLTYLTLDEELAGVQPEPPSTGTRDTSRAGLWGVAVGADVRVQVWSRLHVTGRLTVRWGTGTRDATVHIEDPVSGEPGTVKVSDSVDQWMWGADLGLKWAASDVFEIEGGWRHRDWTYGDGPASFTGPYVKAGIVF